MFRLDLNEDLSENKEVKTPDAAPVPEGLTYNPNAPWSSLFDWDAEEKRLTQEKEQKQSANQRIMRTNAIGDAFRLLIDAVGGSKGARIVPRPVNPGIVKAVESYWKAGEDYQTQLQGLSAKKLAAQSSDLQYKLGLESEGRKEKFEAGQTEKQMKFTAEEAEKARTGRMGEISANKIAELEVLVERGKQDAANLKAQAQISGDLEKLKSANAIEESNKALENQLQLEKAKAYYQRGMFGEGGRMHPIFTPPKSETIRKEQEFIVPDLPDKPTIYLSQALMDDLRSELQSGRSAYDDIPQVLKDAIRNERIEYSSLKTVFRDNWEYLKKLLPPDTYKAIYGDETQTQQAQQAQGGQTTDAFKAIVEFIMSGNEKPKAKREKIIVQARKYMPGYSQADYEEYADSVLK